MFTLKNKVGRNNEKYTTTFTYKGKFFKIKVNELNLGSVVLLNYR